MKTINEHIKSHTFKNVYLLYGPEDYLRRQYMMRLRDAVLGDGDTMNYHRYEGKDISMEEVASMAETLPFFADYRLIEVVDSGWFEKASDLITEYVSHPCPTTILVFNESKTDKRSRLFKAVSKTGCAALMDHPKDDMLLTWIGSVLKQNGRKITRQDAQLLIQLVDDDMENLRQELEKLICYTQGRDVVSEADIRSVCCIHTENRIFEMIDAMAARNPRKTMALYRDLLSLREPPLRILALIARQLNQLVIIRDLIDQGFGMKAIAERSGIRDFIVRRNMGAARKFTVEGLRSMLELCVQTDEDIKSGRITDTVGLELVVARCLMVA